MSIIKKLAFSLNRNDEQPNIDLADEIVTTNNKRAITELFDLLLNKNKTLQNDCIKVIYEIGTIKPSLIGDYAEELLKLLESNNNRLQWGAMTALNTITSVQPEIIFKSLPQIIKTADKGSVITHDQCVEILIKLCGIKKYKANAFGYLMQRMENSAANQLPMYAERAMTVIDKTNKDVFLKILQKRFPTIEKDSKSKRVEKLIKKLTDN